MRDRRLAAYDPAWPRRFEEEAPRIAAALAPVVAVEHVGSTAVPGLAAKPTIDVAVARTDIDLDTELHERMKALGYHYGGTHDRPQHVFRKGSVVPWEFLVHVVVFEGPMWQDYIRFRDHLRAYPDVADRYEALKASLLVGRCGWYSGADKAPFIGPILSSGEMHP
jgi:GrpB-like predicted nucleotidyltransferase (UPF0157 family)